MLAYLYIMASANQEFQFTACLAYDIAFRKKAAKYHLGVWGQIDPQIYSKAFTGASRRASSLCSLCLATSHGTAECPLYTPGPAKKPRASPAGPRRTAPLANGKEICLNYNRGRCSRDDCPRSHACSFRGCGGAHPALRCTLRRSSPRKT